MFSFKKYNYHSDSERIARLQYIVNFDSPFAPEGYDSRYEKKKKEMLENIQAIEDSIEQPNSQYYYALNIAYRNFCAWFIRGDDRIPCFKKQIEILNKSIELDSKNYSAYIELLDMLINHVQVRDLDRALEIAAFLEKENKLPGYMQGEVQKAKKWKGEFEISPKIDFSDISPAPGILREQKSYYIAALKSFLDNNDERAVLAAKWLYNLAIYACKLYGISFNVRIDSPNAFDYAEKISQKIASKVNFEYLGRIKDCTFLSTADYNKIEKALGKKEEMVTLDSFTF